MFLVALYGFFQVGKLMAKGAILKPLVQMQDLHFQFKDNCVTAATIALMSNTVEWIPSEKRTFYSLLIRKLHVISY